MIQNAIYNYQRLQNDLESALLQESAHPSHCGALGLPVFALHFAAPAILSSIYRALSIFNEMLSRGPLLTDSPSILGYLALLPPTSASACVYTNDRGKIAYNIIQLAHYQARPHDDYISSA